jgi:hypothetical protein
MNNFVVNLNILDECCSKCGNNTVQKDVIIRSTSQAVDLQGCYILNVIAVDSDSVTVIIQNGIRVFIRNVYTAYSMQVSLPADCNNTHVITITAQIS